MKLSLIAAVGKNGELGFQGDMPWKRSLKKDLKFFKEKTLYHPVVMGRKTYESFPGTLPDRENIVISTRPLDDQEVTWFPDLESFLEVRKDDPARYFVIGGASVYKQLLDQCDELFLTEIDQAFEADCFFPVFDTSSFSSETLGEQEENGFHYTHRKYKRLA